MSKLRVPFALALLACACSSSGAPQSEDQQVAAWGHLGGLAPTSPQFLVNKARGQTYRVCLASYMTQMFPGVRGEIEAAINVWAAYLGRSIPVEIVQVDLPRATAAQGADELSAKYNEACGAGFDVVVGLGPLHGSTVGETGYSSMVYPDGRVASFRRYLFLRDYDAAPSASDGRAASWSSLEKLTGAPTDGRALLAHMLERNDVQYQVNDAGLTLAVLTHEFGHVWGLCDQYEGTPGCDRAQSSSHPEVDSVMGPSGMRQRLFLTDDDIEGLRKLGGREGYAHDWGAPPSTPPAPVTLPDVELARIDGVERTDRALVLSYGLVTHKPTKVEVFIRAHGGATWTPLVPVDEAPAGVNLPLMRLSIGIGSPTLPKQDVRLKISFKGPDGAYAPVKVLEGQE